MRLKILILVLLFTGTIGLLLFIPLTSWRPGGSLGPDSQSDISADNSQSDGGDGEANAPNPSPFTSIWPQRSSFRNTVGSANNRMHVYAMVVDQFDQPLANVRLKMRLRRWVVVPPLSFNSKFEEVQITSDEYGRVDYDAGLGDSIDILEATSPGLELELKMGAGIPFGQRAVQEGTVPTREKPAIVQLGRSLGKDLVLQRTRDLNVTSSIPIYADLVTGKMDRIMSPRSDLKLVLKMTEPGLEGTAESGMSRPLALEVQVMTGGLAEAPYYFRYQAPSQGYSNGAVRVFLGRKGPYEAGDYTFPIYFRIRDKFYGSAVVQLPRTGVGGYNPLTLMSVINPSGGRILQGDPTRVYEADRIDREELSRRTASQ